MSPDNSTAIALLPLSEERTGHVLATPVHHLILDLGGDQPSCRDAHGELHHYFGVLDVAPAMLLIEPGVELAYVIDHVRHLLTLLEEVAS